MTTTTFIDRTTVIQANWCQDVNDFTYTGRGAIVTTPVYDEQGTTLGRWMKLDNLGTTITVPANKQFDFIGIRDLTNIYNMFTIGANSTVVGYQFMLSATASSDATSNCYGVIGVSQNQGPGTTKGIYGSAQATSTCTGNVIGLVSRVYTGANQSAGTAAGLQLTVNTEAGAAGQMFGIWIAADGANKSNIQYGILMDQYMNVSQAGFQMAAVGSGDFLRLLNSTSTANIFWVTSSGTVNAAGLNTYSPSGGINITLSTISRTVAAGNLTIEAGSSAYLYLKAHSSAAAVQIGGLQTTIPTGCRLNIVDTTVVASAGAVALPANAVGFLIMEANGSTVKVPYYS